ncbi:hypothetical protein GCM10025331_85770 [Actinoplanes utahensis]
MLGETQLVTARLGEAQVGHREVQAIDGSKFVAHEKRAPPSQEAPLRHFSFAERGGSAGPVAAPLGKAENQLSPSVS